MVLGAASGSAAVVLLLRRLRGGSAPSGKQSVQLSSGPQVHVLQEARPLLSGEGGGEGAAGRQRGQSEGAEGGRSKVR